MNWNKRYRIKLYVHHSIWIFPVLSIAAALIAVAILNRIELALNLKMDLTPETARTVMGIIAGSMFSLVVIASSAVLLAVQLASAQMTPRLIALIYRSNIRRFSISLFVFTFTFSVAVLVRIDQHVPALTSYVAAYGFLLSLALFLFFLDHIGKTLRPSTALRRVALAGRDVIHSVYPRQLHEQRSVPGKPTMSLNGHQHRVVLNKVDGVILAIDLRGLVTLAEQANCLIELVPQVGDFVAAGDPLFRIYEGGDTLRDDQLRGSIAVGQERTLEQDPMFALRIMVDIASKALSPAINDPTTAVLSIDQLHHLLRDVGNRHLSDGRETDSKGHLRLIYRTPTWEEFVYLGVTEIRQYGRESVQVMRRLKAMLENLIETLPERRSPLLRQELRLLAISSKRTFLDADDQSLADTADLQGIGGVNTDQQPDELLQRRRHGTAEQAECAHARIV
jgi:uncharacterized membrane protein